MFSKRISINSLEEISIFLNLASLLEISGWPKPGNVHRTHDYEETRYEHFLAGVSSIQPNFYQFCHRIFKDYDPAEKNYDTVNLGSFYISAVKNMMRFQKGGNVLLGHILILSPLCAAVVICLKAKELEFKNFKENLKNIIKRAEVKDTELLYKAIKICNPGGLGEVSKFDINDDNSLIDIYKENVTLKKIFDLSKDYDLISYEYSSGFQITLEEGMPYLFSIYEKGGDINKATVETFLKILSNHPDTLIIRKAGEMKANRVSEKAKKIIDQGGMHSNEGRFLIESLDKELQLGNGELNPGTTADILAGTIFCALIFGLRF